MLYHSTQKIKSRQKFSICLTLADAQNCRGFKEHDLITREFMILRFDP